jgi:hypothetical protein
LVGCSLISTDLLSPPAICYPKEAPSIPEETRRSIIYGVGGRGILRRPFARSCIDRPPRSARMASKAWHASWRRRPHLVVLNGYARRRMIQRLPSRSRLSYVHCSPTPAQRYEQEEGRRGVREDSDPAIGGLYPLVLGLSTPLHAQFHWPFRRPNIFLAFLIRSLRSSTSVSRARILRCSSVDL